LITSDVSTTTYVETETTAATSAVEESTFETTVVMSTVPTSEKLATSVEDTTVFVAMTTLETTLAETITYIADTSNFYFIPLFLNDDDKCFKQSKRKLKQQIML